MRRATSCSWGSCRCLLHFYPRSPCGERRRPALSGRPNPSISIHALLAESDVTVLGIQHRVGISIHALLAESDNRRPIFFMCGKAFLSTLSLRRATYKNHHPLESGKFLSTLSLRRATWQVYNFNKDCLDFYPRSPCGERLFQPKHQYHNFGYFYPRSPCGERPMGLDGRFKL